MVTAKPTITRTSILEFYCAESSSTKNHVSGGQFEVSLKLALQKKVDDIWWFWEIPHVWVVVDTKGTGRGEPSGV